LSGGFAANLWNDFPPTIFIIPGCIMDRYAIVILTVSIIFPVVQAMQFDPI
jgi:TRAP-type C4-dicarboxylate transport system permease large subunit